MKKLFLYVFLVLMVCNTVQALPKCKGEDYSKWTNCVGTYTNDEGRKYTGEFGNDPGMRHGKGILILKSGTKYIGTFKNDKIDGRGTLTSFKGDKYVGQFKDGKYHGKGTFIIPEIKSKYVGQWKDGKQHGYGRDIVEGESKYAGQWKDGKQHGRGTFILYKSKAKYVGQWKDGQISKGTLITPEAKYVGEFKDYLGHGQGTATYTDGRVKKGIWENGKLVKEPEINTQIINSFPNGITYKKIEFEEIGNNSMNISIVGMTPFSDQNLLNFIENLNTKIPAIGQAMLTSLDPSSGSFIIQVDLSNK